MPSRSSRSRSSSRGGARPRYRWETQRTVPVTLPAANTNFVNLTTGVRNAADGANRGGTTLVRSIGSLILEPITSSANTEVLAAVTQLSDAAIGGLAFPSLTTGFQQGWLWWVYRVVRQGGAEANLVVNFDVKSKRRYRDGDSSTVFLITNADTTQDIRWSLGLRMLFKISS